MKRQIKLLMSVVALGAVALTLSACGKSGANQVNEEKVSFIKDAQSSNQRIWYMAVSDSNSDYELSKNTEIRQILLTKNGKATVYNMPLGKVRMRDMNKKTDQQVITLAKKQDKAYYQEFLDDEKNGVQGAIKEIEQDRNSYKKDPSNIGDRHVDPKRLRDYNNDLTILKNYQSRMQTLMPKYKVPVAKKLTATVKTDNSGNDVESENIIHRRYEIEMEDNSQLKSLKNRTASSLSVPVYYNYTMTNGFSLIYSEPVKILDDMYTGYTNNTNDSDTYYLMTKTTNKDTKTDFDKPGTKNVSEEN